jgi:nicotinic acid phosphoribosyltransferase
MTNRFAPIQALTDTDAYKLDHRRQYPIGTTGVLSNFTNRGSRIERVTHVVHFGLQAFLRSWAEEKWLPFWAADEDEVAALYEEFTTSILGPNDIGSDHIRALHKLGYLPLKFRAVDEGTLVPLRVPSFTVENTLPEFYWLVNYIETALSSAVWQPSTSATTAHYLRKLLDEWALKTTGSTDGVQWQGHDFSFRGMAGIEAAAASGAGHLLSFTGSDNLNVVNYVNENYEDGFKGDNGIILGSVPATEHSVMCAGGSDEGNEQATYERVLSLYPTGIVSVVSDTWDLWNVLTEIVPNLKDQIMAREGKLVIRPDSGDPVDILTGSFALDDAYLGNEFNNQDQYSLSRKGYEHEKGDLRPDQKGVIELLWETFGGTVNEQGYKVLDSHIGAIYGDSITYERAEAIMKRLESKGFASTNVVFGVGSYTYQYVTRDTFASAIKATWVEINGKGRDIMKDPVTDSGLKKSAKGRIAVVRKDDGELHLIDGADAEKIENTAANELHLVWADGSAHRHQSFADVRNTLGHVKY